MYFEHYLLSPLFIVGCVFSQDILYQFPSVSSPAEEGEESVASMQRRLVKLRGLFLTLSDVLGSLVGPAPSW